MHAPLYLFNVDAHTTDRLFQPPSFAHRVVHHQLGIVAIRRVLDTSGTVKTRPVPLQQVFLNRWHVTMLMVHVVAMVARYQQVAAVLHIHPAHHAHRLGFYT
jgi:hypothetical protein